MIHKHLPVFAVTLFVAAFIVESAIAQTSFSSFASFGKGSNEPIQIEALKLEVLDQESKAVFTGDVLIMQGVSTLKSQLLTIHYDGNGTEQQNISKIEASGGVLVSSMDQKATADEAVLDSDLNRLVMTGEEVVLSQGSNVIVGNKLTVELASGRAKMTAAEGTRVKVLLDGRQLINSN